MLRIAILFVGLLLLTGQAFAQLPTACDCAKCLAVDLIKTVMAKRHYSEALELAEARAAWARSVWPKDAAMRDYWATQGKTLDGFIDQITKPILQAAHERIGDDLDPINKSVPECAPELGGLPVFMSVDVTTCSVRESLRRDALLGSPCFSYYMATLSHEMVHIADCKAVKPRTRFTPIEMLRTEVNATSQEADVIKALYAKLMTQRQCTPTSTNMTLKDPTDALELLKAAEAYHQEVDGDGQ